MELPKEHMGPLMDLLGKAQNLDDVNKAFDMLMQKLMQSMGGEGAGNKFRDEAEKMIKEIFEKFNGDFAVNRD